MSNKKGIFYLGAGFLLIAIGELSTILTKLVLYYDTNVTQDIGRIVISSQVVQSVDVFYNVGFFFNRFLTLLGLYVIYKLPSTRRLSAELFLTMYLIFIVALLSHTLHYLYNLTALILLVLIIHNYYNIYKKDKLANTKILISAFVLLSLSQILFILSKLNYFYVGAQSIQLVSYIILLGLIMKIIKNGKEKKQSRHNT
jgi:hypothetical protein|tara:strand:+ start:1732 stop:2328 length:597 start_codon:yes stop_codon:yes gene_type:complete